MEAMIVYASNSGSTYQTSKLIRDILKESGHNVTITKAVELDPKELKEYDLVLIGSPSWLVDGKQGQAHETIKALVESIPNNELQNKKMAFFGCGDKAYTFFCKAVDELEEFGMAQGATQVVPSLKIDEFYFNIDRNTEMAKAWAQVLSEQLV